MATMMIPSKTKQIPPGRRTKHRGADRSQRPIPERKPELNKPGLRVERRPQVRLLVRQLGPRAILVALTLAFRRDSTTDMLEDAIRKITKALQLADDGIAYVYVRPSQQANQSRG